MGTACPKRLRQLGCAPVRRAVLVALCVPLLQLPVPLAHEHASFASSEALADHLDRHHASGQEGHDWHWHFVLPCDLCDAGRTRGSGDDPMAGATPLIGGYGVVATAFGLVQEPGLSASDLADLKCVMMLSGGEPRTSSTNLLDGHAAPLSVSPSVHCCAVLQVIRC